MKAQDAPFPVLPSIRGVIPKARWVRFNPDRLASAVASWGDMAPGGVPWEHPCHYSDGTEETVRWIFTLDVLNHCFWPDPGQAAWGVHYRGRECSGYWGLAASLKRAMESGVPMTDPAFLAHLPRSRLEGVFSGVGRIPLFEERLANLREAGRNLLIHWRGDIVHLLEEARNSAVCAVHLVVSSFPSFRDEAVYGERTVFFWKRAQLFVADVHAAFGGAGWGRFEDLDRLTAFADYKLPQVLRALGILSYHPRLAERIDALEPIPAESEEEVEIRAATVYAVEALKEAFQEQGRTVTSTWVDHWLWHLGQLEPFRKRPYHRCRTIYY